MKYNNKELGELSDDELQSAKADMRQRLSAYHERLSQHPKLEKLKPKPEPNPAFLQLQAAIDTEINNRKASK
jgi:hypothetical protein